MRSFLAGENLGAALTLGLIAAALAGAAVGCLIHRAR